MSLTRAIPELGQLVKVRSRQYVVTEYGPLPYLLIHATRVTAVAKPGDAFLCGR